MDDDVGGHSTSRWSDGVAEGERGRSADDDDADADARSAGAAIGAGGGGGPGREAGGGAPHLPPRVATNRAGAYEQHLDLGRAAADSPSPPPGVMAMVLPFGTDAAGPSSDAMRFFDTMP